MDLQDKYDDLDEIVSTINTLINNLTGCKEYIEELQDTMYKAQEELDEIEPKLAEQYEREERELENEYIRSVS